VLADSDYNQNEDKGMFINDLPLKIKSIVFINDFKINEQLNVSFESKSLFTTFFGPHGVYLWEWSWSDNGAIWSRKLSWWDGWPLNIVGIAEENKKTSQSDPRGSDPRQERFVGVYL
jgi:hypothetical protein